MALIQAFRRWLLHAMVPVTKLIGLIQKPEPKMSGEFAENALKFLQDGDVLLSHNELNLTNLFIPGFWKHAAIYRQKYVVEAIGHGVVNTHVLKWILQHDNVIILRPKFASAEHRRIAADIAQMQTGKQYDFELSPGIQSFYCSELVFWSYQRAMNGTSPFTMRKTLGVDTVVPTDFSNAKDKFEVIAEFKVSK